ncbi:hypothetical protein ACFVGY_30515 [Streptomyces sp. NPDC127106]|uniref:hypothetical protein n=1 Tax=Streptomyces sp. NPDC127106 TaxID=3345360 RepID=UPI0036354239
MGGRLDDPFLTLASDIEGEDRLSGWSTDRDADAFATLGAGEFGAMLRRLTVPGAEALAVPGEVRLLDRSQAGTGGLRVTLAWPARLRGMASLRSAGGVVRHAVAYTAPGEVCVCRRQECGGVTPVGWCAEHGDAAAPAMEWHPGGGLRCMELTVRS